MGRMEDDKTQLVENAVGGLSPVDEDGFVSDVNLPRAPLRIVSRPYEADAYILAKMVELYPDAVRVLFRRPTVTAKDAGDEGAARLANPILEDEQCRRVRGYVRARLAITSEG
jgi:hypothetical protein